MLGIAPSERPNNGRPGQSEIWQIFGKMDFYDNSPEEEKALITALVRVRLLFSRCSPMNTFPILLLPLG